MLDALLDILALRGIWHVILNEGLAAIDRDVAAYLDHLVLLGLENRCPPKAEVTGSNPVGRANKLNDLAK